MEEAGAIIWGQSLARERAQGLRLDFLWSNVGIFRAIVGRPRRSSTGAEVEIRGITASTDA
jgi:hypothetical protein